MRSRTAVMCDAGVSSTLHGGSSHTLRWSLVNTNPTAGLANAASVRKCWMWLRSVSGVRRNLRRAGRL